MPDRHQGSSQRLKLVDHNGLIAEDVMNQIWDISRIPLPYTDLVGSDTCDNSYTEWTTDHLRKPQLGKWVIDGSENDVDSTVHGKRLGNHCGILIKRVNVTERAQASNTIGYANALSYQVMMRQRELRRDVEANLLHIQGSDNDDAKDTPGQPAGLAAMVTQFDNGSGATGGGFSNGQWTGIVPGNATALTEKMVRDALQEAWEDGADPSVLMTVPGVIRHLSEYMFTSSSRIATLTRETRGAAAGEALGTVNTFITDFGVTVDFIPNRIQQTYWQGEGQGALAAVYCLDPAYLRISYLKGYRTVSLAKTGLSDKREIAVDFTQKVLNPDAHRVILDIDPDEPVTQA